MSQFHGDLTLSEVLNDPLILSVARADGMSPTEFKTFLYSSADRLHRKPGTKPVAYQASVLPHRKLQALFPAVEQRDTTCGMACY